MPRWSTLSSVSFDKVVLATLNPKTFSPGPSRENKFHCHDTSSSPNCPSSAGLSSTPVNPLGSWPASLPPGSSFLEVLLLGPRQYLGRICLALTVRFLTILPQPYLSPLRAPLHQVYGNPCRSLCPGAWFRPMSLQVQVVIWVLLYAPVPIIFPRILHWFTYLNYIIY